VLNRALQYAVHEQQRSDPSVARELPRLLAEVTEDQVRSAAAALAPARRAVVEVVPATPAERNQVATPGGAQ